MLQVLRLANSLAASWIPLAPGNRHANDTLLVVASQFITQIPKRLITSNSPASQTAILFYCRTWRSSLGGTALDRSHGHAYCLLYRRITPAMSLKCCKLWQQEKSESGERSTRLAKKTEQIPEQCVMSTRMKLCEWVSEAT